MKTYLDKMDFSEKISTYLKVLLISHVLLLMKNASGLRYKVSDITTDVIDVNRVAVVTDVKSVTQCARKCHQSNCTSFTYGEKLKVSEECYSGSAAAYHGRQSRTVSGLVCQRWDSQFPHAHMQTDPSRYPDATITDAENFCRDPDGEQHPWCYTTDPVVRYEFCPVYPCDTDYKPQKCFDDALTAKDYNGTWSKSRSGKLCQRWDTHSPHTNSFTDAALYPDATLSDAANHCRDPSNSGYTWCYTTDTGTRWEACDVTSCTKYYHDSACYDADHYTQYTGSVDVTINGLKCQRWDLQTPHAHSCTDPSKFPDATLEDAANYCRDPDGSGYLWCYTTDPSFRWTSCGLSKCPSDHVTCYDNPSTGSYMGTWSRTQSGRVCQRWDSVTPHSHTLTVEMFEEDSLTDAENYCRDPTGTGELWCYTTDPMVPTETCGIGKCTGDTTCQGYADDIFYNEPSTTEYYTIDP